MHQALYMWDSFIGNGTVTHQFIGYLFPMGPYYWAIAHLGIPMWIGQRFWLGSIFFVAGTGVMYMGRRFGLSNWALVVPAIGYMLSPYVLSYSARLSALLLPFSAAGWLVGVMLMAIRNRGWRYPAIFALILAIVSSVNATAVIYILFAPVALFFYEIFAIRSVRFKDAFISLLQIALLSFAVSFWWIMGLVIEFSFALNIVQYTETIVTVTLTSTSSEVFRGLGYWFFYGEDQIDNYIQAAPRYMTSIWLLALSTLLPITQLLLGLLAKWRYRMYFAILVFMGMILAVGAYPYENATPFGAGLKIFQATGIAGLALRSDNRAVPVILLGLAGLCASGISVLFIRWKWAATLVCLLLGVAFMFNLPSLFSGNLIGKNLLFPQKLPSYYYKEAKYLNAHNQSTRVLDEPGDDFAYYQWGTTVDPVDPALLTRPFVAREQVPYGSAASADLLNAFDEYVQETTFNPLTLAPIARLMSVGDVVLRSDLAYERYNTPRPRQAWSMFDQSLPGIGSPIGFGKPGPPPKQKYPLVDETALARNPKAPYPPKLAVFPVSNTRPIVRTESAQNPILLDGDGIGMVQAAQTGLLNANPTIFYSSSFAKHPRKEKSIYDKNAQLVVTDSNYLTQRRWGTVRENVSYIEQPGQPVLTQDPTAHSLHVFPHESSSNQTVAKLYGVKHVIATSYGNPISFVPENKPYNAIDGNLSTVWTTGAFENPIGQRIRIEIGRSITTNHIVLVQPLKGPRDRYITKIKITFQEDKRVWSMEQTLNRSSRTAAGQTVTFPTSTFQTLEIRIQAINLVHEIYYSGVSGVGFAEIGIPGVNLREVIRMPQDLLDFAGKSSATHPLTYIMHRRQAPPVPPRTDPELNIVRQFYLPTSRSFSISGTARISALIPDITIDQLLGRPGSNGSGITVTSSGRLPGDLNARGSMALDGNPNSAWMPGIGPQVGHWIQVNFPPASSRSAMLYPHSFSHLNLQLITDGRHSVPTQIQLSSSSGSELVTLPNLKDSKIPNATTTVPINFPTLYGNFLRLTIVRVRNVMYTDYYSGRPDIEPVGIAELGIPNVTIPPPPTTLPNNCLSNLISIDGKPLYVQVFGSEKVASSETGLYLGVRGCGPDANGVFLNAGSHILQTGNGSTWQVGYNIDSVVLASSATGQAVPVNFFGQLTPPVPQTTPSIRIIKTTPTSYSLTVGKASSPFWLVLGQSYNKGWQASITATGPSSTSITATGPSSTSITATGPSSTSITATGPTKTVQTHANHSSSTVNLGPPTLIDGMSNAWLISPTNTHEHFHVVVDWYPQKYVFPSLYISAIALILIILIIVFGARPASSTNTLEDKGFRAMKRPYSVNKRKILISLLVGVVTGIFVNIWLLPIFTVFTYLSVANRLLRWLAALAAPILLLSNLIYQVVEEAHFGWHALFGWVTHFQEANTLTWLGVSCFLAFVASASIREPVYEQPENVEPVKVISS